MEIDVLLTPAEFAALRTRDLGDTVCVVFDILRATTSIVTALSQGARAVCPMTTLEATLEVWRNTPGCLLAGEREGLRIGPESTGGIPFDFGNSPREFTADAVRDRTILMTTTNGTRALQACAGARWVMAGAFANLSAVVEAIPATGASRILLVCAGTGEEAAYEDVLAAGAVCARLEDRTQCSDAARIALHVWAEAGHNLVEAMRQSRNARRLLAMPRLAPDVEHCARCDVTRVVPVLYEQRELRLPS